MEIRCCHSCKVYVTVLDGFEGQNILKGFEKDHRTHPRGTMQIFEATGYTNVDEKYFGKK